jgi:hypothetical protein
MWPLWLLLAHGAALQFLLTQAFAGHDFGGSVRPVDGNDLIIEVATVSGTPSGRFESGLPASSE